MKNMQNLEQSLGVFASDDRRVAIRAATSPLAKNPRLLNLNFSAVMLVPPGCGQNKTERLTSGGTFAFQRQEGSQQTRSCAAPPTSPVEDRVPNMPAQRGVGEFIEKLAVELS